MPEVPAFVCFDYQLVGKNSLKSLTFKIIKSVYKIFHSVDCSIEACIVGALSAGSIYPVTAPFYFKLGNDNMMSFQSYRTPVTR